MKAALIAGLCLLIPAAAHHSMAGFDRKNTVTLEGTVKNFSWQNPHCWIEIEVAGKDSKPVVWNVEMTAPGYLARVGWKKTAVKPGDKVAIVGNPLLNGEPGALFVSVTLPDGQRLTQRGADPLDGKAK
jgi:Family of unknown function (DUF6152)